MNDSQSLDGHDVAILEALQKEARLSAAALAEEVHLSATPCWRRVRELESSGAIRGYRAELDREALGLNVVVFIELQTDMDHARGPGVAEIEEAIRKHPNVLMCHSVSGDCDYLLELAVPDFEHFARVTHGELLNLPGVTDIKTSFSLKQVKARAPLPLGHLREALKGK